MNEGWVIDRDYLNGGPLGFPSRVGYGQIDRSDVQEQFGQVIGRRITVETGLKVSDLIEPVRFRALDEDGEVYYGGAVSMEWLMGEDDLAYSILSFVEADVGATEVQFRAKDLPERFVENHRAARCVTSDGGTEWVTVYG